MFELPVEKNFTLSQWATAVAVSTGSVSEYGLNYSKIGPLINGHYVFQASLNSTATFVLPIKSYLGITLQASSGNAAPIAATFGTTVAGYVSVTGSVVGGAPVTCRFVGSDSHTLVANNAQGSRALTLNQGKYFAPPLTVTGGTISGGAAWYQYVKYPIKLILGTVVTSTNGLIKFNLGAGTKVLESWLGSNSTTTIGTVVAGTVTTGGITFQAAAAGTHTFLIMLKERGI